MSLDADTLDAFIAISRTGSFSKAAKEVFVTQSALSQRIKKLEDHLGITLLLRVSSGVQLTESGERLLRYCQLKSSMEQELMAELAPGGQEGFQGEVRIGCYSSVFRSVILPALAPLVREIPDLPLQFVCAQMSEMDELLKRGEIDFVVVDEALSSANLETVSLGFENYVMIDSVEGAPKEIFLDQTADDVATRRFLAIQPKKIRPKTYRRRYMDDCYGIIDGVEMGLGRAVMPRHLVSANQKIAIDPTFKTQQFEVLLQYFRRPYLTRLQSRILETLAESCPNLLEK